VKDIHMPPPEQRAREILLHWEPYRSMSPQEIGLRIDVPLHLGFADVLSEGIFVSWTWLEQGTGAFNRMVFGRPPHFEDWSMAGPVMWLMDVAGKPGLTGMQVGRAINRHMQDIGIVQPGDRAAFRRRLGKRYGWATAREVS
jgi:hypothetical protein